jgi:hypothetical protein
MAEQQNDKQNNKQINKQNTSETKTVDPSYAERLAKALESMKGTPLPTDFDELDTQMTDEIWLKLHPHRKL